MGCLSFAVRGRRYRLIIGKDQTGRRQKVIGEACRFFISLFTIYICHSNRQ